MGAHDLSFLDRYAVARRRLNATPAIPLAKIIAQYRLVAQFPMEPASDDLTCEQAIERACESHRVHRRDLMSFHKDGWLILARQEAYWLCFHRAMMTKSEIGRRFNGRGHNTVSHGIAKHQARIDRGEVR